MTIPTTSTCIVFLGKTGSGKTLLLQQLAASGYPIIDIERMASHRGSAFGGMLLPPQPSQNDFDIALSEAFLFHSVSPYIFIEQKVSPVGKLRIPGWLNAKMIEGISVQLEVDKKIRVQNILKEYSPAGKESFQTALNKLNKRLPITFIQQLEMLLQVENYTSFISTILEYYDATANYNDEKPAYINLSVSGNDPAADANEVLSALGDFGILIS
jgi:tRNA 2-selenouridine synthase